MTEHENLAAFTEMTQMSYPPYISINLVAQHVEISVRSPPTDGKCNACSQTIPHLQCGHTACIELPRLKALEILEEAVKKLRAFT